MSGSSGSTEDEAWREIVENYGERAAVDESERPQEVVELPDLDKLDEDDLDEPGDRDYLDVLDDAEEAERFVPPPPPPLPRTTPQRFVAWLGLIAAPAALLICLVAGMLPPDWVSFSLVAWFLGGFGYLVWHMPKHPNDPYDDGARV
ncbi:hypothetical protein [Nocardioides speluncae]|uniref:hypothetical protein n=1 Tax=Nocardioides speluncae TaxID=2670337 RepID=UPI000D68F555|nr:hypothetical protein [Nocardioides speluncae]